MRNQWQLWRGALSDKECDDIIEYALQYSESDATVFFSNDAVESDVRSSIIRWLPKYSEVEAMLTKYVRSANRAFAVEISELFDIQFTEYRAEQKSHYDWHHDINWDEEGPFDRKLSIVVQLSNPSDYKGGEFEFKHVPPAEGFETRGSVLVFPSYHQHRVLPVTEGKRYSLVSWCEGPRWR